MAISTSLPISLSTVISELGLPSNSSLLDCFANAVSSAFDPTYGSIFSDNLQAFRGYEESASGNVLRVTPTIVDIDASSDIISVTVQSNTTWAVSESLSWVTISPTSGSGNGSFNINIATNNTGSPRSGDVTVQTTSGSPTVTRVIGVTQGSGFE